MSHRAAAAATVAAAALLLAGCTANEADEPQPLPSPTEAGDLFDGEEPAGAEAPVELILPPDTAPSVRGLVALPPPEPGVFRSNCGLTHLAKDDPIVFPGESKRAHMHGFHGSVAPFVDERSTSASIVGHGTTCDRPEDESAYWSPVLGRGDALLAQGLLLTYYRTGGTATPEAIQPFPVGFRMIAGSSLATAAQSEEIVTWGCSNVPAGDTALPPAECPPGEKLKLSLTFPSCWDGVNLDSPTHGAGAPGSHVAYSWEGDGNRRACPAGYPVVLPELRLSFRWDTVGSLAALRLTSGTILTGHADFMNGWEPAKLAELVATCLNVPTQCDRGVD